MEEDEKIKVWIPILIAVSAVLFLLLSFRTISYGMTGSYGMMNFGMGFGFIFMILFWGLLLGGVVWLITALTSSAKSQGKENSPLTLLKKRYVKGEISKEEYEEMREEIEK